MKVVQINTVCGTGSTGRICVELSKLLTKQNIENYILYASGKSEYPLGRRYMEPWEVKAEALKSRLLGNFGFNSKAATRRMLRIMDEIRPDVVHLHNLHGHNCNLEELFSYLKDRKIKTFWTFHDCWALTGYCPHYDMAGCEAWKESCSACPQRKKYSWLFDRSRELHEKKKELFLGLDLTIIAPSMWMAQQVKQSFLHNYEVQVIYNGIDLNIFQPTASDLRKRINCEDKFIVLGVSNIWVYQKGLDVFIELAKRLDDRFRIVMVGTDDAIDAMLPANIISIHRTQNSAELAEIYTAADIFINPTRQEVLGLTNIEALACGTPVVTFHTGGSPECIDSSCGVTVSRNDIDALEREIVRICTKRPYPVGAAFEKAKEFDANRIYDTYRKIYMQEGKRKC